MSDDFLSSLAAQALGTASVVRPRVAARFEPRPAGGDLRRGWPEPDPMDLDAQPWPIPPAREVRRPDLATVSPLAGRAVTWDVEAANRAPMAAVLRPSPAAAPERSERAGGTEGPSVPARREPAAEPPVSVAHVPAISPEPDRSAVRRAVQPSTTGVLAPQSAAVVPEIGPAREAAVPEQGRRMARESADGRAHRPHPQGPAEPGPNIQVTIGRVEVRATTSAAPGPARPPAAPIMTLEEYLHRRTERGNP